jgi:hypothetical protein
MDSLGIIEYNPADDRAEVIPYQGFQDRFQAS